MIDVEVSVAAGQEWGDAWMAEPLDLVVVGASAGGVEALRAFAAGPPGESSAPSERTFCPGSGKASTR